MWRYLRIALLLFVLVLAAVGTVLDRVRTTDWDRPLRVGLFPISADGRKATDEYIDGLGEAQFALIIDFFERQAERYGLAVERPIDLTLHDPVPEPPPLLPRNSGALGTMLWSLKLRWYNWRVGGDSGEQIRMYVLYHDPSVTYEVPHSLGLQKGLVGVVYAYADESMDGQNNLVIAHELLHTVGATDKYDPQTLQPQYPGGYAEPLRQPRHPQTLTEIMAGRRVISAQRAEMPPDLERVVIGAATAAEIRWLD
jgi:hypothetical protein